MFIPEEWWAIIVLWVAEFIYEVASWSERNPFYGSVFIWVITAVGVNNYTKDRNAWIQIMSIIIGVIHTLSMGTLWTYTSVEEFDLWEQISFWDHGFLSNIDWTFQGFGEGGYYDQINDDEMAMEDEDIMLFESLNEE